MGDKSLEVNKIYKTAFSVQIFTVTMVSNDRVFIFLRQRFLSSFLIYKLHHGEMFRK